jgi:hypothetical protein
MTLERSVRLLAGSFVLISLILSQLYSPYWLLFTAFVGANLVQSSFTKFCPAEIVIRRLFFEKKDPSKTGSSPQRI